MSQEPKRGDFAREKGEIILREHEYDGIQEYDQKLPRWWLFTFYAAIAWFVVHWVLYYHTSAFKDAHEEVKDRIVAVQKAKSAALEKMVATLDDSKFVHEWAANPEIVAAGEATFLTNCIPCHGADLSATILTGTGRMPLPGLPLNDHVWKFGDKPMRIFQLINEGSPPESAGNNGAKMQVWGQTLSPKQIAEVVSYIISKVPDDFKDSPEK
jgi:cytochrome c oxidase cbb3-type subunit 3